MPNEVDAVDQDPVDAAVLAEVMYPHIEQAAEVCAEEADRFFIEGFELAPYPPPEQAAASAVRRPARAVRGRRGGWFEAAMTAARRLLLGRG